MVEKTIDLTGISSNSIEDAVNLAVNRAAVTIQGIREARIVDVAAVVEDGSVASWRVKVKVTFTVQDRVHE
jgi:dodecin